MLVPLNFEGFYRGIALNPDRESRIERAVTRLHDFLDRDALAQSIVSAPIPQGSWAQGTIVRPLSGDPYYDIDFILPMDVRKRWGNAASARDVLNYVADRLRKEYPGLVQRRNRCARIRYQEGFQIDLVPGHVAKALTGPYQICNYDDNDFEWSNPVALNNWVSELNKESRGNFGRAVVCLKRWRDLKLGVATAPKSILMTVLAGTSLTHFAGDKALLTNQNVTLEAYVHDIAICMHSYLRRWPAPLRVPGMDTDLNQSWAGPARDVFKTRLVTLADRAQRAIAQTNGDHAVTHWQAVFGNYFPREA